jgi:hypothetical protein
MTDDLDGVMLMYDMSLSDVDHCLKSDHYWLLPLIACLIIEQYNDESR